MAKTNIAVQWAVCDSNANVCFCGQDRRALIYCNRDDARRAAKDFAGEFNEPLHVEKVEVF